MPPPVILWIYRVYHQLDYMLSRLKTCRLRTVVWFLSSTVQPQANVYHIEHRYRKRTSGPQWETEMFEYNSFHLTEMKVIIRYGSLKKRWRPVLQRLQKEKLWISRSFGTIRFALATSIFRKFLYVASFLVCSKYDWFNRRQALHRSIEASERWNLILVLYKLWEPYRVRK